MPLRLMNVPLEEQVEPSPAPTRAFWELLPVLMLDALFQILHFHLHWGLPVTLQDPSIPGVIHHLLLQPFVSRLPDSSGDCLLQQHPPG